MSSLTPEEIAGLGFEEVVGNAPVAISVIAACGRVIYSNARAREFTSRQLGYDMPPDLDGALVDIFYPDGRRYERHEWPAVRSITSGEEIAEEEFFYALPDRPRLFMSCSSSPVRDEHGEIIAAVLTMTDITERKRQEERLTYLAGLLDNTEDGIVAMDERYILTVWNTGAERLYGWNAAEVVGRHVNEVAVTSLGEDGRDEMRRELAENGRWRGEAAVARKDGTTVDVELVSVVLRGQQDEITGYLTIHRDITERTEAEQRVAEAREAERGRIARALHDDALQGLSDAIALVAAADRTAAESGLSRQLLPVLRRMGEQLRFAIYDLHTGSKEKGPFVELLARLVDGHRTMVGDCKIQLEIGDGIPTGSLGVTGVEVLRIVGEALRNACRHAEAEHVRVRARGSSDRLWVEVSDDGRGFDTGSPGSPIHRGITGMRERAELLNGRLQIHSEPGVGTSVRLEAPLANATS